MFALERSKMGQNWHKMGKKNNNITTGNSNMPSRFKTNVKITRQT